MPLRPPFLVVRLESWESGCEELYREFRRVDGEDWYACELAELVVDEEGVRDLAELLRERGMLLRSWVGFDVSTYQMQGWDGSGI